MNIPGKKKDFLKLPRYPGGSSAFRKFITDNLHYPKAALEAKVEGTVIVGYDIDDNGFVHNAHILKGLGHGCDEEALRLIGLLRYGKVKNRKIRVNVTTRTNIHFRLPKFTISYIESKKKASVSREKPQDTYEYTINLGQGSKS